MQNILQMNPGLRVERLVTLLTIFGKQVSLHHSPTVINSSGQYEGNSQRNRKNKRAKIIIYYFWNVKFRKSLIAWLMNGAANGNIFLYETENQQNNTLSLQDLK